MKSKIYALMAGLLFAICAATPAFATCGDDHSSISTVELINQAAVMTDLHGNASYNNLLSEALAVHAKWQSPQFIRAQLADPLQGLAYKRDMARQVEIITAMAAMVNQAGGSVDVAPAVAALKRGEPTWFVSTFSGPLAWLALHIQQPRHMALELSTYQATLQAAQATLASPAIDSETRIIATHQLQLSLQTLVGYLWAYMLVIMLTLMAVVAATGFALWRTLRQPRPRHDLKLVPVPAT